MLNRTFALTLLLLVTTSGANLTAEIAETSVGGAASLFCNLEPLQQPDKLSLIAWYKENEQKPFYKYDDRSEQPHHWVEPAYRDRFFLRIVDPDKAALTISPTLVTDEAIYHCRVEFQKTPSRIGQVNLTVIVPPESVQILDDTGPVRNGITSAYAEGASLSLTCVATGGRPLPHISWSHNGTAVVSGNTEYFLDRRRSQNIMRIMKLTRAHLLAVYSCEASNSRVQRPLVVRVAIDMYLRPLEVNLVGENREFSAGRKYDVICKCKGSRPPATITWWKDGISLEGGKTSISSDGNTTQSVLSFTPTFNDNGLILTCKASNQRIPFSEQQRTWMLRVLYPPKVALELGHGLDERTIIEGSDVYFDCHILANPKVTRVRWLRDGTKLYNNATAGIIISNQTLVLQGVSRKSSGRYCCEASNQEGVSKSPPFDLRIKYEPICGDGTGRKVLGAAKGEPLRVECKVDAEPAVSIFRWSFNSTPGISKELDKFTSESGFSVLTYVAKEPADYGTIQCWGSNHLGEQKVPCTYHIVPAGRPDPPASCLVGNVTHNLAMVTCQKTFDGGLKQQFVLTISLGENVIANLSAPEPQFNVTNLEPAQEYRGTVFSMNPKGRSKSEEVVSIRTLPAPGLKEQRRITEQYSTENKVHGPWLYILLAAGSTLIVAAAVGGIILAIRKFKIDSPVRERRQRNTKQEEAPSSSYTDATAADDKNPDLIPPTNESLMECGSLIGSIVPYTITARPSSKRNCATQMPVKPYHVTWAPILQSRNCSTQTPLPHKESSV